ncbi:HTH-type transcriptional regulator DmlR [BD1-7 clade bacterium]|uniref:HTH-type transcriptional regulator DmlR n=1 Tax=BD1-7 clade bacterium TaxID=2029982 RepID=A0A5S9QKF4_9GAMM|nr:HTH-type transcriptional regulator DmlR [BD1-7 clade bacterium]
MKDIVRDLETIDFRTLTIFVTTCRLMSLTKCAELMQLPKSTVSKAIVKLEDHMQARLLERSTRKMHITDAGNLVFERASILIDDFQSLHTDVLEMEQQVQGLLRVSAPPAMGDYLVQHVFSPFLRQWPKAKISLEVSYGFDDLFAEGIDMAIRVGRIVDDRLVAREIGYTTRVVVASPAYLKKHGTPRKPVDLKDHKCVEYQYTPGISPWTLVSGGLSESIEVDCNFFCSSIEAVKRAAVEGLGVAQVPVHNLGCELKYTDLVQILPEWHAVPMPIYLVYRPGANKPRRVRELLSHIVSLEKHFHFGSEHHLCQGGECPDSELVEKKT